MLSARTLKLDPEPVREGRFHPAFIDELAGHPHGEALLDEIQHDPSIPGKDLRRGAIAKVREENGAAPYRFKPNTDHAIRILYPPDGNRRDVVMALPRSSYRRAGPGDGNPSRGGLAGTGVAAVPAPGAPIVGPSSWSQPPSCPSSPTCWARRRWPSR